MTSSVLKHIAYLMTFFGTMTIASASAFSMDTDGLSPCAHSLGLLSPQIQEVSSVREALKVDGGKGYVLLNTENLFPEELYRAIFEQLPKGYVFSFDSSDMPESSSGQYSISPITPDTLEKHGIKRAMFTEIKDLPFPHEVMSIVQEYGKRLEDLINEAQKGVERVKANSFQIRTMSRDQKVHSALGNDNFHVDGGYITATVAAIGPGTVYTEENFPRNKLVWINSVNDVKSAKRGQTLFVTNADREKKFSRTRGTFHAAPEDQENRLLILIRFDPIDRKGRS
jgi:hypothetical protein